MSFIVAFITTTIILISTKHSYKRYVQKSSWNEEEDSKFKEVSKSLPTNFSPFRILSYTLLVFGFLLLKESGNLEVIFYLIGVTAGVVGMAIWNYANRDKMARSSVTTLAIGKFDSFHLGHRELFKLADAILIIDKKREKYVVPPEYRNRYIELPIFSYEFSNISNLSGEEFVAKLISEFPKLSHIVVGYDFKFGKDRSCDATNLESLFSKVTIVDEVVIDNISVHSKDIQSRIISGDIGTANRLLGRNFSIIGNHFRDRGVGKAELVPTLNISYSNYFTPKEGVYKTQTSFSENSYKSITFIGNRDDGVFSLETHIIGEELPDGEFGEVEIEFISYVRENRKFSSNSELLAQIEKDLKS
jgi:riboflavin kinase/FMN adenylyltransferase